MLKSIFGTIGTRIAVMGMTVGIVLLNTHKIGAEGQGTVALISLGILLIFSLNNFIGGGAIVYLTPRMPRGSLFMPSIIWSVISTLVFWLIFSNFDIVPAEFVSDILILGFIQSLFGYQQQVMLGRQNIKAFNGMVIIQWFILLTTLAVLYYGLEWIDPASYIKSLYVSFTLVFLVGLYLTRSEISMRVTAIDKTIKSIVALGFYTQTSNVLQLLINRFSFILLDQPDSRSDVGVFSVGMQINEAALAPSKSAATVQYAGLSNSTDQKRNLKLSVDLLKISVLVTLIAASGAVLLPESFYLWLFGDEMMGLSSVLKWLFPGMMAMSATSILAHHFSGTGRPMHNMIASIFAFILIISLGYHYIPIQGITGAAWITSASFGVQMLYLTLAFLFLEKPGWRMLFSRIDFKSLREF